MCLHCKLWSDQGVNNFPLTTTRLENTVLPSLVNILAILSALVMTLKRDDINWLLVKAIGVLLHCEYYI